MSAPGQVTTFDLEPDDLELVEMANLPTADTGVEGTIYISTMQGQHGPRVKWYPGRPGRDLPCLTLTLESPPRTINHGLSVRDATRGEGLVQRWVDLNRDELQRFWFEGASWLADEVYAFVKGLRKLP